MLELPAITGLTADSRQVRDGYMFVAIPGLKQDGRSYIADAINKGAKTIVVPKGTPKVADNITWLEVDNTRAYLAEAAASFYQAQPQHIVAVTGTNGKTSTVNFCRQIWELMGIKGASLGTLGLIANGVNDYNGMTTLDPVALHQNLKLLADKNITHLAMEASSQGIDQERLRGLKFRAIGFTNLTQDHLDYHQTMENYLAAKLRVFQENMAEAGVAVINADDPAHESFVKLVPGTVWTYGGHGRDLRIMDRRAVADGQILVLELFGKTTEIHLPLVGLFQAMNVLCAAGIVCAESGVKPEDVVGILPKLKGIPGRLQRVLKSPAGIGAYIDYAHTPDGLENILTALRPHTQGRLICVFGCGGDRDRRKRPIMGGISARLADITIITDDNPRSEDATSIRAAVQEGAPNALSIGGRREAIRHAVSMLREGDVLVVAGKGHEQEQIFADHTEFFDDYTETETAFNPA